MAGYFVRRKGIPFTQVSNEALHDSNLSLRVKGLYCVIQSYIAIPDFTLYKSYLRQMTQLGPKAFDADWNELKKHGYLKQARVRTESGFVYEYELLDRPDLESPATVNIGLNGAVTSIGNGKSEPTSVEDGTDFGPEFVPTPVEGGTNLDMEVEPTPLRTRFTANPVHKGGDINNNNRNNTYEEIDRVIDADAAKKELQTVCKGKSSKDQKAAIRQELREYLNANGKLPDYIWASRMRCTEGIRLLTHETDYTADEPYSSNPIEQNAYKLFGRCLIQMCLTKKPMQLNGESVTAADVIEWLNANIEIHPDPDAGNKFGLFSLMDSVIDTYCHAEITKTVKKSSAYMKTCIWSKLCDHTVQKTETAQQSTEITADPADVQRLEGEFIARKDIRTYLIENHELPYEILDSEPQCTAAIHLLTHYEQKYSSNRLTQAAFELFNYSLIQMCLSQEPLKPRGAHVTSAKVLQQLNTCIDFSDDPHYPFGLDVMRDIIDDYRQAEIQQAKHKQAIKNKVSYMQSCIWSRLITHGVSDGIIREQIGMYAMK